MEISLDKVHNNPHRNMQHNPVNPAAVSMLVASMQRNSVWANVVVREHPENSGHYELAYGHHRLAAMKKLRMAKCEFIVKNIDDWGMYNAMVDENESHGNMTPALISENINAGIDYLTPIIKKCKTLDEFTATVPCGTMASRPEDYQKVRDEVMETGEIGRRFLEHVLPGELSARPSNLQEVLNSRYKKARAAAETVKKEALNLKSKALRGKAKAEKDLAKSVKLEAEAAALDEEANAHQKKAIQIAGNAVDPELLVSFDSAYAMTEFAAAVRREKVPQHHHAALVKYLRRGKQVDRSGDPIPFAASAYAMEVASWWFENSGKAKKQREWARATSFKAKHSKTLEEFCAVLRNDTKKLVKGYEAVTPYTEELDEKNLDALEKSAIALETASAALRTALTKGNPEKVVSLPEPVLVEQS